MSTFREQVITIRKHMSNNPEWFSSVQWDHTVNLRLNFLPFLNFYHLSLSDAEQKLSEEQVTFANCRRQDWYRLPLGGNYCWKWNGIKRNEIAESSCSKARHRSPNLIKPTLLDMVNPHNVRLNWSRTSEKVETKNFNFFFEVNHKVAKTYHGHSTPPL